ncbi:Transmembrane protein 196 [Scophthalmus maximus]|uniref:Transmembrane protein 196 n=1 Tax=Scophthalmus maximus TaxID=52904 RepID=A0A2U9CYJ3_SCOMX|nr:Transmembrane protein 196 [Scophthalmus maximus]
MCSSRKILWSLLLLSVVEVGLGVASIVLGAVGIIRVRGEHKAQQGDASPVWSGLCVRPAVERCPAESAACMSRD